MRGEGYRRQFAVDELDATNALDLGGKLGGAPSLLTVSLSGALIALSFPPFSLYPCAFISLVPLMIAIAGRSAGRALFLGWVAGIVFYACGFSWLPLAIVRFEELPYAWSLPIACLFWSAHALHFALFAAGVRWLGGSTLNPLVVASWWVLLEWGFPKAVPWTLGSTLGPSFSLRQAADLFGVYGLSFAVVAVNALIASAMLTDSLNEPKGAIGDPPLSPLGKGGMKKLTSSHKSVLDTEIEI
jgi:apolipoprotein N-acyltransferase